MVYSLLLAIALVLLQACATVTTAPTPPPQIKPFFSKGFCHISEYEDSSVGALAHKDGRIYGSGVLVGTHHVLTAAHCADNIELRWFISGGEFFEVCSITIHPYADIAILHLGSPCSAAPSLLPQRGCQMVRGDNLIAIGYGGGMRRKSNPGVFWYYGTLIEEPTVFKMLPLDGTIWFGDSGGAIYDEGGILVGIISSFCTTRGYICDNSAVRIDIFCDWINKAMEETPCN